MGISLFGDDGIPEGEGPNDEGLPRYSKRGNIWKKFYEPRIPGVGNVKGEDEPEEADVEYVELQ